MLSDLTAEISLHHDVIAMPLPDIPALAPDRLLHALVWLVQNQVNTKYILKITSNAYIDVPGLLKVCLLLFFH